MSCRICSNNENNKVFEAKEMMFGTQEIFHYLECSHCGCLQLIDTPDNLEAYYPAEYYSLNALGGYWKRMLLKERARYALTRKGIIGRLVYSRYPNESLAAMSSLSVTRDMSILDVGCGQGSLLYPLPDLGFRRVMGVDPYNDTDIRYPNGLVIRKATLSEIGDVWDLVMFNMSFEHVDDPLATLRTVARMLSPEGVCMIRIPVSSSWAWRQYGVNWVQLDAPRHIFLHTEKSMALLAEQAGLKVTSVRYDSSAFQFWGSEQYAKGISLFRNDRSFAVHPSNSIFSESMIKEYALKARELNAKRDGDQAVFLLHPSG